MEFSCWNYKDANRSKFGLSKLEKYSGIPPLWPFLEMRMDVDRSRLLAGLVLGPSTVSQPVGDPGEFRYLL